MISQLEIYNQMEEDVRLSYGLDVAECFFLIYLLREGVDAFKSKRSKYAVGAEAGLIRRGVLIKRDDKLIIAPKGEMILEDIERSKGDVLGQMYSEEISWNEMEVFFSTMEKLGTILKKCS